MSLWQSFNWRTFFADWTILGLLTGAHDVSIHESRMTMIHSVLKMAEFRLSNEMWYLLTNRELLMKVLYLTYEELLTGTCTQQLKVDKSAIYLFWTKSLLRLETGLCSDMSQRYNLIWPINYLNSWLCIEIFNENSFANDGDKRARERGYV